MNTNPSFFVVKNAVPDRAYDISAFDISVPGSAISALTMLRRLQKDCDFCFEDGLKPDLRNVAINLRDTAISQIGGYNITDRIGYYLLGWFGYKSSFQQVMDAYSVVNDKLEKGNVKISGQYVRLRGPQPRFYKVISDGYDIKNTHKDKAALPSLILLKNALSKKKGRAFGNIDVHLESVAVELRDRSIEQISISPARAFFEKIGSICLAYFGYKLAYFGYKSTEQEINATFDEIKDLGFDVTYYKC